MNLLTKARERSWFEKQPPNLSKRST